MEIAIIPRFIINKFIHDEISKIHANVLITSILIIFLLLLLNNHHVYLSSIPHFCLFQKILNIPCPGCGVTRSLLSMSNWNLSLAWQFNPAGVFLLFYIIAQVPLRIIALKFYTTQMCISQISRLSSNTIIIVLFFVWILRLTL